MKRSADKQRKITIGGRDVYAHGLERSFWGDFYTNAMTVGWPVFVAWSGATFLIVNAIFAGLYALGTAPVSETGKDPLILDYFYFSIETLATVGYGDMHPQTDFGHAIASVEMFVGLFLTAVLTGLIFARFSRPRARFIFARNLVIGLHDGQTVLTIRLANGRLNLVSGASAQLWVLRTRVNAEGVRFRGFEQLKLERFENPFFALSWTLFHRIDEASPLYNMTHDNLGSLEAQFLLTITGHDESASQSVYARQSYTLADIRWDHRYVDIIKTDPSGQTYLDYRLIHDTEPFAAPQPASASSPS